MTERKNLKFISGLTVQWQSWLRHTRTIAPTIQELVQEERRRGLVKERAKVLDEEWEQVK